MSAHKKLQEIQQENKSIICLGLDLDTKRIPAEYNTSIKGLFDFAQAASGMLYLGTARGVFQSGDGGIHWSLLAGEPWETERIIQLDISDLGQIWVTAESGVYVTRP